MGALFAVAGCSSDIPPASSQAAPAFDSFDKIGKGLGCHTLAPLTDGEGIEAFKAVQECNMGDENGTMLEILQFADKSKRDAVVANPQFEGSSFLMLNDTWAVTGTGDDIIAAHSKLNTGELVTSTATSTTDAPADEPTDEPSDEATGGVVVAMGKSVTNDYEQVKVTDAKCDLTSIPKAEDSGKYDDDGNTIYKPLKAKKGETLCRINLVWKNVGKKPNYATSFGTVVTANGTEYDADEDAAAASNNLSEEAQYTKVNPGKGYKIVLVYSVPKGANVIGVNWGDDNQGDAPYVLAVK